MTNANTEQLIFDATALLSVAMFMAPENDPRHCISGVRVQSHPEAGVHIVATDGHQMAIWHDPNGQCDQPRILKITPELVKAVKKAQKTAVQCLRIHYDNGRLVLAAWSTPEGGVPEKHGDHYIQTGTADIDGTYPDIRKVIPKEGELEKGLYGSIAARHLKRLGKASVWRCGITFFSKGTDGKGVILARYPDNDQLIILTMPQYSKALTSALPPVFAYPTETGNASEGEPQATQPA